MFKSKGFTIAFAILSVIIIALGVVFCTLVFGKRGEGLIINIADRSAAAESSKDIEAQSRSEEEENRHYSVRALHENEPHVYPIVGEIIPETGLLTIVKAGSNDEGITFHAKPQFDSADAEGNVIHKTGSFEVTGKVFVLDNGGDAYPMYVADGYFVTSNKNYVSYRADATVLTPDEEKTGVYGYDGSSGIIVRIFAEDGNHVAFSIGTFTGGADSSKNITPVLENLIAKYDSFGVANFEFWNQSETVNGSLVVRHAESGETTLTVRFESPVLIGGEYITEFEVKKTK